jgi:phospholipase/carboxylesterase
MIFLAAAVLLGALDPMDIHSGDFLDLSPREALTSADEEYRQQNWLAAVSEYLNALKIDPGNSTAIYNLACCYGLMGEEELATLYLKRSFTAGFDNLSLANADTDFDPVRESTLFSSVLDSLNAAFTEHTNRLGEVHWFDSRQSFFYRINFPEGFNPPEKVPVVIGLHGLDSSPDNFMRIWELIENPNFIFVVPQAPYSIGDDSYSWYTGGHGTEDWGHSLVLDGEYVLDLVEQIKLEYPVSDVYLFGFSQGGCLALYTGLLEPELFKAIIPSSGWLEEELIGPDLLAETTSMQIELMHSPDDRGVSFDNAERALSVLSDNGWDIELHQTSGPHMVDMDMLNEILLQLGLAGN